MDQKEEEGLDDEESQEEQISEEELNNALLTACRENNYEEVVQLLDKKANALFKKDGWTPLLWAACNGNEQIVRALIKHNAHADYINTKNQQNEASEQKTQDSEDKDPFVKPPDARKIGKYTPLHWASYKGHYKVVWILLKVGMSALDIDQYGNTAVHQAAASGDMNVLKCFLSRGVDIDVPNARLHTPLDLTTEKNTKDLIIKAMKTKQCQDKQCNAKFDFKNLRYFCEQSGKFFCVKCSSISWVYENWDSEDMERPVCRSLAVSKQIQQYEEDLKQAIDAYEFSMLDKSLLSCKGIDIDVKLKKKAEVMHLKLEHELKIKNFLKEKDHHDDYKEIRKDITKVNDMVQTAMDLEIDLDSSLVQQVNQFTARLTQERNMRKQRDLFIESISSCDSSKVEKLQNLIDKARQDNVEQEYIVSAEKLISQMRGNIKARETLQVLLDYPEREYPEPEEMDPKKKDKKAPPPKKKKKKEPPFPTPEWAEELQKVIEKVKEMQDLAADKVNLKLDDEFIHKVGEQLHRFKKEIMYRKQLEEEARLEAELKAMKKKAKKK